MDINDGGGGGGGGTYVFLVKIYFLSFSVSVWSFFLNKIFFYYFASVLHVRK